MNQVMGESFLRHEVTNTEGSVVFALVRLEPFFSGGRPGPSIWAVAVAPTYRERQTTSDGRALPVVEFSTPFFHNLGARSQFDATKRALDYIESVGTAPIVSARMAYEKSTGRMPT